MQRHHARSPNDLQAEQENALSYLLDSAVCTVPYLTLALRDMHQHLSIHNKWEMLAGYLGLNTGQVAVYASLISANPSRLPSETFFLHFSQESYLSLRELLEGLMAMAHQEPYCRQLVQRLINDAWEGYHRRRTAASASLPK